MKSSQSPLTLGVALACTAILFSLAVRAEAQTYTDLADFNGRNGAQPWGALIQGTNGNLYGTAANGGKNNSGTFFELTPAGKLSGIYSFCSQTNCADGANPYSGPILGSDGNFYGVTRHGGNSTSSGTFYKMTTGGKITTLYTFCPVIPCIDGQYPNGVVQASNGNFYGTTSLAGQFSFGTIFEISSTGKFKLLYTFCAQQGCVDGGGPYVAPIQADNGNFYGAAWLGGSQDAGVVYEMTPAGSYKVLYNFCSQNLCADGSYPNAIVQDGGRNLIGTTFWGGAYGYGTVFEITPRNQYILLHTFDGTDGSRPAGVIIANDGNLYGTTTEGGGKGYGNVFEITLADVFTSLYNFCNSSCATGSGMSSSLFQGTNGTLYGTPVDNGFYGDGNVSSLSNNLSPLVETVPVVGKVGKRVIILGNGLTGSSSVTFNGTVAAFTVVSDTEIAATVPTGATTGTVSVVTPTGTLNSNPVFHVLQNELSQ